MSGFSTEHEYDRPPHVVWAALTDPELLPLWTSTGQSGLPRLLNELDDDGHLIPARPHR